MGIVLITFGLWFSPSIKGFLKLAFSGFSPVVSPLKSDSIIAPESVREQEFTVVEALDSVGNLKQRSMGVVVSTDGQVLTQMRDVLGVSMFRVIFDDGVFEGNVTSSDEEMGLLLINTGRLGLKPVQFDALRNQGEVFYFLVNEKEEYTLGKGFLNREKNNFLLRISSSQEVPTTLHSLFLMNGQGEVNGVWEYHKSNYHVLPAMLVERFLKG